MKKKVEKAEIGSWDEYLHKSLQNIERANAYLNTFLEDGTSDEIVHAIHQIMAAQGRQASKAAEDLRDRCKILLHTIALQQRMHSKKSFLKMSPRKLTIDLPNVRLRK